MSSRITHDQKEAALEARRQKGTMVAAAEAAGVSVRTLNNEMRRSAVFKKRMQEAAQEGHTNVADIGKQYLIDVVTGKIEKTDRNRVTAATILLNAYEPGFRGTTQVQGRIDHDVRVITAVPRPNYQIIEPEKKLLDDPDKKVLKPGKRTKKVIVDEQGNYIGTKVETVEDVIEGEIIKESE